MAAKELSSKLSRSMVKVQSLTRHDIKGLDELNDNARVNKLFLSNQTEKMRCLTR